MAISITVPLNQNFCTDIFKNSYLQLIKEKSPKFINENQNLVIDCGRSKLLIENYVFTGNYFA